MVLNAGIHTRGPNVNDLLRAEEEFQIKKQLAQAEVKKAGQVDVDKLGEQAFMKAAMGEPLSKEEQAAAMFIDAKSGGISFNPATGEVMQKPRISDKIGLPRMTQGQQEDVGYGGGMGQTPPFVPNQGGSQELPPVFGNIPMGGGFKLPPNLSPKARTKFEEENIGSAVKTLEELQSSAGTYSDAARSASIMEEMLPDIGYTGTGGALVGKLDEMLTSAGKPNWIKGEPAARDVFKTKGVDAWASAVEKLKGALTEREGARFDAAVSNLGTTKGGILARSAVAQVLSDRANLKNQYFSQYFQQNGNLLGANAAWEQYTEQNPIDFKGIVNSAIQSAKTGQSGMTPEQEFEQAVKKQQGQYGFENEFQRPELKGGWSIKRVD